jgi:methionyl-tRNA formyltransferase
MKILLLCTAHNSLSQRLYLTLTVNHEVTIEYALSAGSVIEAVALAHPHLIICPFLTSFVPAEVYNKYMTLVVHPGAPGDGGPSALDFVIMGEDGTDNDIERVMWKDLWSEHGRNHWNVTVLQAMAKYDAGPVWAWEQYKVNIDEHTLSKSSLYRGAVTRAALVACLVAIERIQLAVEEIGCNEYDSVDVWSRIGPELVAKAEYKTASATTGEPFLGGNTTPLPLLKAAQRDFDLHRHGALMISRLIRASDSQPGCLTEMFTPNLYIYGGLIENSEHLSKIDVSPGTFIGIRNDAVCFKTMDGKGIWITRRLKRCQRRCRSRRCSKRFSS